MPHVLPAIETAGRKAMVHDLAFREVGAVYAKRQAFQI